MIKRDLDLDATFLFSEILDEMELEVDMTSIISRIKADKLEGKEDAKQLGKELALSIGVDMFAKIAKKMHKAKRPVKEFIAYMTEMNQEEVGRLKLKEMKNFFTELVEHEGFEDFLTQAGASEESKEE